MYASPKGGAQIGGTEGQVTVSLLLGKSKLLLEFLDGLNNNMHSFNVWFVFGFRNYSARSEMQ